MVGPVHNKAEIREAEREPAVTQVALFRHMCIMDHFHSTAVAFAHVEKTGERASAWARGEQMGMAVKLSVEWMHYELLGQRKGVS